MLVYCDNDLDSTFRNHWISEAIDQNNNWAIDHHTFNYSGFLHDDNRNKSNNLIILRDLLAA